MEKESAWLLEKEVLGDSGMRESRCGHGCLEVRNCCGAAKEGSCNELEGKHELGAKHMEEGNPAVVPRNSSCCVGKSGMVEAVLRTSEQRGL